MRDGRVFSKVAALLKRKAPQMSQVTAMTGAGAAVIKILEIGSTDSILFGVAIILILFALLISSTKRAQGKIVEITLSYSSKYKMLIRKKGVSTQRPRKIDVSFAYHNETKYYLSIFLMSLSLILMSFLGEISEALFLIVVMLVIVAYRSLTLWRARLGWLGNNAAEALELIEFIANKTRTTGVPPGSTMSRYQAEEPAEGSSVIGQGARA